MRIRKRTPARAASPGPSPPLSPSPPPPPPPVRQPPKEVAREEKDDEAEEKRVILVAGEGGREDGRVVPLPAASKNSAADGLPKPDSAAADRCSRNDGKRWRCKNSAVPGFLFCDRHVKWSTRPRQPTANKKKQGKKEEKKNGGVLDLEPVPAADEEKQAADDKDMDGDGDGDGFQPGGRKRARCGGPAGPTGGSVN